MTATIKTTGFAAFSNDVNGLSVMYGYGRTEQEALEDAARYCNENAGSSAHTYTADDFIAKPATEAVSEAAGDQVREIKVDDEYIIVATWEDVETD